MPLRRPAERRAAGLAALAGLAAISAGFRVLKARAREPELRVWRCECGQSFRVDGIDRHRVYWVDDRPVLGRECVRCGAPLPAGHGSG
jgi:hypothetical protein